MRFPGARPLLVGIAVAISCIAAPPTAVAAENLSQTLTVERPTGQLVIEVRGSDVVVTDTRADDPGWSVTGVASVTSTSPGFTDGSGFHYGQRVDLVNGVASAPAQHGLGIAHLTMASDGDTITLTVI